MSAAPTGRIVELLRELVAFPSVSSETNLPLIDRAAGILEAAGFTVTRIAASVPGKGGLLAKLGTGDGGVLFSAHTDVVPVAGQSWSADPFTLRPDGTRLVGRGSTDMKGFVACVLAMAETLADAPPAKPVSIALSWDEEVGCRGIPEMIDRVIPTLGRPDLCIVGEPTSLRLCLGHKGKASYRAICHGSAGHSAMAPHFVNALHGAADLITVLRAEQDRLMREGARDDAYDPPCSTVHAGVMRGGVALNIVPDTAEVLFEIRHLAAETPEAIVSRIRAALPEGDAPGEIRIAETGSYPGLATDPSLPAVQVLAALLDDPAPITVAYGTEAGFFARAGLTTVVCGPGTMKDGHQPDESIEVSELTACAALLDRLVHG